MSHDFDRVVERRGTESNKRRKYGPDVVPLWVADMDFRSPEPVVEALRERVEHGVYGYGYNLERSPLHEVFAGRRHVPIASLATEIAERTVTLMAPSKTWNLAGLKLGLAVIPNAALRPFTFFLEKARVALSDGAMFGRGGAGFVRLNFGCPRAQLAEGLDRMRDALAAARR